MSLWDLWCIGTVVGIWPRYVEPRLLFTNKIEFEIDNLHDDLEGLRILHLSDLHFTPDFSDYFLKKIISKVKQLDPDLIVFTGDLISYSSLEDVDRLRHFLSNLPARYGRYATLGNHDYKEYVTLTSEGKCDTRGQGGFTKRGLKKLFTPLPKRPYSSTDRAQAVPLHAGLCELLHQTGFQLLENRTCQVKIGDTSLNICGLGDHWLGRCLPAQAFQHYDANHPGIVLSHNPDTAYALQHYPGELLLCGHTHGAQINLPFIWKKFVGTENYHLKRGLKRVGEKNIYINRGLGAGGTPFRWFSPPELVLITLRGKE